jgi:hypothetical protein
MSDLTDQSVELLLSLAARGDRAASRELQRRELCIPYSGDLDGVVIAGGDVPVTPKVVTGKAGVL